MTHYIGLMSGTSLDGVDGVLVSFDDKSATAPMRTAAHVHQPFTPALRSALLALQASGDDELHRASLAANDVSRAYASVAVAVLAKANVAAEDVTALGAHGQTVRHRPGAVDGVGYSVQLLNGALLAELSGVNVVCDFRSRDVAAGGQGAPLVPAFHAAAFARDGEPLAVLNLGGMANLSILVGDGRVLGFDTGPGGVLLDAWCQRHRGATHDDSGRWANAGRPNDDLLKRLLREPFFDAAPPKSTGRDTFNLAWFDGALSMHGQSLLPVDVQATLAELTASSVMQALARHGHGVNSLIVCGGGARNDDLLARMQNHAPNMRMRTSDACGIPVDQVEAVAFAWLAHRWVHRRPGNLASVTGAQGERVLGAMHPAR